MSNWHENYLRQCQDCTNTCTHEESYKRLMAVSSPVRYGMRKGAVSPPPPGAGPRYRSQCCWLPASSCGGEGTLHDFGMGHDFAATLSRVPLLSSAAPINSLDIISCANRTEDVVATSDQTPNVSVRDHVLYPGKCLLKKRCALVRPPVYARLAEYGEGNGIKEDHIILDRLPRFRFGGNRAEKRGNDKFRELTERLKRGAVPVPPPRTRHSKTTPPISPSASQDDSPKQDESRVIPLRSASFSQVDYCPDDNKYIRRKPDENVQGHTTNTLPRPKNVSRSAIPTKQDAFTSTRPETTVEDLKESSADIPEVQITPETPEKTTVRNQNNTNCSQDKRRDKSRRRKGIYLSQWPADYQPTDDDDVIINKYEEEEIGCGCDETAKIIQESLSEDFPIIASSPQEEPLSPEDASVCLEWPSAYNKKFLSQSPEEKDSLKISVSRSNSIFRSDSLSEGEPESIERRSDQITFVPSDVSDCESRLSTNIETTSPPIPRRYSKRPLRGPYGQMLEAEMKKPDCKKNISNDLKFLEDLSCNANKSKQSRFRSSCNSSIDETSPTKSQVNTPKPPPQAVNKRKVSADSLVVEPVDQKLVPNHQRTTSSPSKLEGFTKTEVTSELLEQLLRGSSEELLPKKLGQQQHDDTRTHVLIELYDNERSYVESLEIIATNYWEPLKKAENSCLLESNLVEEIFSQIPFLLNHHKNFLMQLKSRLEHWDSRQIIGDVFLEMFSQSEVIDNYTTYVNNWKRSRDIIKNAQQSKPAFGRFLEATARQHTRKLALDSLLIKPIQKFPKYKLLLQRLIKHTNESHPDYQLLLEALQQVHDQLLKMNCTEKEALDMERLRELESLIEGALDLVAPDRQYVRHDMVIMSHGGGPRKERAVFLFTDLLLIAGIKRRSGPINKKANATQNTNSNSLEGNKYKLMMKVLLEDVEIIRSKDDNLKQMQIEIDNLNEDITILNQINELSWTLHCSHVQLDELIKDMLGNLNKQLHEQQSSDVQMSVLDLTVLTQNGIENVSIVFPKPEIRTSWEETLLDAKTKLLLTGDRRPTPEMMATVPIRKTRAGLQFTCAAPTLSENGRDVWVCNSDGYVGQVCVLTLNEKPEPTVTSCNGVCNTRILCIASVPGPGLSTRSNIFSSSKNRDKLQQQKAMQFDSSSSSDEDDHYDDETHKNIDSEPTHIHHHTEELDKLSTMWLGTEDGCIHIFNSNDNIRIKKNKIKLQLGGSVLSIIYLENRVFASLANGYITIFDRDSKGGWNTSSPQTMGLGTISTPVSKMVVCNSKIYCACGNTIIVFNPNTLEKETTLAVSNESSKSISCMLLSGNALWLSLQNSANIKCFHAISLELLCETNVAPAVTKMLTSCDDIIRQHKAACLRVTALVHCKDLLWIGTSAGVLLTMPLPHITPTTTKLNSVPVVSGVPHGHTGHVRILTSVEMPYPIIRKGTMSKKSIKLKSQEHHIAKTTKFLVISGGDGYEDFRTSNISEVAGREDSTNHLLLWNI